MKSSPQKNRQSSFANTSMPDLAPMGNKVKKFLENQGNALANALRMHEERQEEYKKGEELFRKVAEEQYEKEQRLRDIEAERVTNKKIFFENMNRSLDQVVSTRHKIESDEIN